MDHHQSIGSSSINQQPCMHALTQIVCVSLCCVRGYLFTAASARSSACVRVSARCCCMLPRAAAVQSSDPYLHSWTHGCMMRTNNHTWHDAFIMHSDLKEALPSLECCCCWWDRLMYCRSLDDGLRTHARTHQRHARKQQLTRVGSRKGWLAAGCLAGWLNGWTTTIYSY
jgi:hypothetical protein